MRASHGLPSVCHGLESSSAQRASTPPLVIGRRTQTPTGSVGPKSKAPTSWTPSCGTSYHLNVFSIVLRFHPVLTEETRESQAALRQADKRRSSTAGSVVAAAALLTFAGAWGFAWLRFSPPPIRTGPSDFSVERALKIVHSLAAQPRAPGSEGHARAQKEIAGHLAEIGAEVEVQRALGWADDPLSQTFSAGTVWNVLGRLRGTGTSGSVLLIAHYDTVALSAGASDDGAGVAMLLEVARLLRAGPPLQRDVLLLFTDGEEEGLIGINAFLREHPAASNIAVAVNLEARGTQGPSLLFETGHPDSEWVDLWATLVPDPVGNSVAAEIYRRLPNDTDFTTVRQKRIPGFNFAFIEGLGRYHTAADRIEALEPRSLAHQGNAVLALARSLAARPTLPGSFGRDAVFFDVGRLGVIRYSERTAIALALTAAALCIVAIGTSLARRRASIVRIGLSVIVQLLVSAVLLGGVFTLWWTAARAIPELAPRLHSWPERWRSILLLLALLSAAGVAWADSFLGRWLRLPERALAFPVLCASAAVATALWAPGASYVFGWPAFLWALWAIAVERGAGARAAALLSTIAAGATALVVAPVVLGLGLAMPLPAAIASTALVSFAFLPVALLLSGALSASWVARGASLGGFIALALALAVATSTRIDDLHPHPENLIYVADYLTRTAVWATADEEPGPFSSRFLHNGTPAKVIPLPMTTQTQATAPFWVPAPPPLSNVELLNDGREARLRLTLAPGDRAVWVDLGHHEPTSLLALQGVSIPPLPNRRWVRYRGDQIVELILSREHPESQFRIRLLMEHTGLPALTASAGTRPSDHPGGPDLLSDVSLIAITVTHGDSSETPRTASPPAHPNGFYDRRQQE